MFEAEQDIDWSKIKSCVIKNSMRLRTRGNELRRIMLVGSTSSFWLRAKGVIKLETENLVPGAWCREGFVLEKDKFHWVLNPSCGEDCGELYRQ